jgi:hypothetical protein
MVELKSTYTLTSRPLQSTRSRGGSRLLYDQSWLQDAKGGGAYTPKSKLMVPEMSFCSFVPHFLIVLYHTCLLKSISEKMKVQYGNGYIWTLKIDAGFLNGLVLVAERPRWRGGMG